MKTAIVYDRVNKWGGAERVLLALHELYPHAPLYTSVYDKAGAPWAKVFPSIKTSFLQKLPFAKSNHELLAPLMPAAFESFDFSEYDVVISVTSEAAKGVRTNSNTIHICYCLTPTRYLWSGYDEYIKGFPLKAVTKPVVNYLRKWDLNASKRPDVMIAISTEVQKRIQKYYCRDSQIIFPPVNSSLMYINEVKLEDKKYYLIVSRLVGYKKVDLAISAFNKLGYQLKIVGTGRELNKLKKMAGKNIKFLGHVPERNLPKIYNGSKALIMPQEEDYGIVALEAQNYGIPVIAYKKGGVLDTVIDGETGVFFKKQDQQALIEAILKFEKIKFDTANLVQNAKRFSKEQFSQNFAKIVTDETKRRKL